MTGWHLRCPNGHTSWRPKSKREKDPRQGNREHDESYHCPQCEEHFDELVDLRTE